MDAVSDMEANEIYSQDSCSKLCFHLIPEKTAFFLYHLIDRMSDKEVQAQEDKLRKYFKELQTRVQKYTYTTWLH